MTLLQWLNRHRGASSARACVCLCVCVTHFRLAKLHPSHKCKAENKAALAAVLCLIKIVSLVRGFIILVYFHMVHGM